jgi:predicted transcriptional regulator
MPKTSYLDRKLAALPVDRRAKVDALAANIVESNRLSHLREKLGVTQSDLADRLSVNQAAVSQIERRGDLRLSTLRRYVAALGGRLEVRVKIPRHQDVVLS